MKKIILFFNTVIILCIISCSEDSANYALAPKPGVCVIKFKQPEYKNYIMTYSLTKDRKVLTLATTHFAFPASVINMYGQSPYVELSDNYLLIDWKWGRIYYPNNEAIINEKWTEFKDIDTKWPVEKLYINRPVEKYYYVYTDKIKEYNEGYLKYDSLFFLRGLDFSEEYWRFSDEEKEWMMNEAEKMNKAYMEYTEILNRMINDGKLDKYGIKIKLRKE